MKRRSLLINLPALIAVAVARPATATHASLPSVPTYPCGCTRLHPDCLSDTCLVHDEAGRPWESYSAEEIARRDRLTIDVQTEETEWSCFCGDHDDHPETLMPVGMLCVWSIDYHGEGDCRCLASVRREWLACVTTDWLAMAKEDDARWRAERAQRVPA